MKTLAVCSAVLAMALFSCARRVAPQETGTIDMARQVIDDLFDAFNDRDSDGYYATFHYPQVSIGTGGGFRVSEAPPESGMNFDALTEREGWHHSVLQSVRVVDASPDKVHFDVCFTRHKANGSAYAIYRGVWIITRNDGRWAVQARSFMPTEQVEADNWEGWNDGRIRIPTRDARLGGENRTGAHLPAQRNREGFRLVGDR